MITSGFMLNSSPPPRTAPAAAIDLRASLIAGSENSTPMSAPPSSRPMPSGRFTAPKRKSGAWWAITVDGVQPMEKAMGLITKNARMPPASTKSPARPVM